MFDLHGKNYGFTLLPTYQPIAEDNCVAVASKTRKNILITMQVCPYSCAHQAVLDTREGCKRIVGQAFALLRLLC